ncbi:MAG: ATP-binding protein [Clostridiales bacterium]|nr:ATP-binding protein [Clostridiales bacterium]
MKFVNRKNELRILNEEYIKEGSAFTVIYGRRRKGKTTLIKEFIKDKKAIYFFADTQNEKIQIARFQDQIANFYNDDFIRKIDINTWEALFEYIESKINAAQKTILVIDEFQYLVKRNKHFSSVFQRIFDTRFKDKNIMIILCGSLINMMYRETLAYNSPLYGRRTSQINLKQIPFKYYKEFFGAKTNIDFVKFYSITGGIPKYIEVLNKEENIFEIINNELLNKNKFLYVEPRFILQEEVNEVSTYFSILEAIAAGNRKLSTITKRLGMQSNRLTVYLKQLFELDIIEKIVPVTETNPEKSKKGLYFIKDNYFKFWFKFIFPYQSYLEIENKEFVLEKIASEFDLYVSETFEDISKDLLFELELPFIVKKHGKWWDRNAEIDVVAIGEDEILFGECKWSNKHIGLNILKKLKEKAKLVNWRKNTRKDFYILFSKSGFSEELTELARKDKNILLIGIDDFFVAETRQ